jgi:hypothetical protein
LKNNYFSSHKLPKQQSTSFWSQGILGVKNISESPFLGSTPSKGGAQNRMGGGDYWDPTPNRQCELLRYYLCFM